MNRLKQVADVRVSNVDKKSYEGEVPVRLCNYTDVYYGDVLRADTADYMQATASASQIANFRLCPGDTVLTKDSETADDIGVSAYIAESAEDLVCGYHLAVVRPRTDRCDPKFLSWYLRSIPARDQLSVAATGVTRYGLRTETLANLVLDLPPLDEQRRIADFLDDQVALLDQAIALRQQQIDLLEERRASSFLSVLTAVAGIALNGLDPLSRVDDWRPLSRVLRQLTNGYVGPTRDLLVEEGTRYLQSLHIKNGGIDFERRPYYVPSEWVAARPRITLRLGDVLIVQTGALGEVAIVGPDFVGASCHALLIARVQPDVLLPEFLWHLLRSDWGKHALLRRKTGALHPHLEAGEIRDILVPVPSLEGQAEIIRQVAKRESDTGLVTSLLLHSRDLLTERKQALITAAVTGKFDVTAARGVSA